MTEIDLQETIPGDPEDGRVIDLHTHSTASDGSCAPSELIRLARDIGRSAVALTDHDCTDGIPEARREAGALGTEVVPGIELSVESDAEFFSAWRVRFSSSESCIRRQLEKQDSLPLYT